MPPTYFTFEAGLVSKRNALESTQTKSIYGSIRSPSEEIHAGLTVNADQDPIGTEFEKHRGTGRAAYRCGRGLFLAIDSNTEGH
jgi:hypothetical protein